MKIVQIQAVSLAPNTVNLYALDEEGQVWLKRSGTGMGDGWSKVDLPVEQQ